MCQNDMTDEEAKEQLTALLELMAINPASCDFSYDAQTGKPAVFFSDFGFIAYITGCDSWFYFKRSPIIIEALEVSGIEYGKDEIHI